MIRLFLIDALGNLALFGLAFYWLGLPASSTGNLILSAALALVILILAAYLIALAFNRDPRQSLARIPAILCWMSLLVPVAAAFFIASNYVDDLDQWVNSALTMATRTPVHLKYFGKVLAALLVIVLIRLLLPVAARAADAGVDGLRDWRPVKLSTGYLITTALYLALGLWLPYTLFWWIPEIGSFTGQMLSATLRIGAAFALYVGAWLLFAGYVRGQALSPER